MSSNYESGVVHLFLLAVMLIGIVAVFVGMIVFKPDLSSFIRTEKMDGAEETVMQVSPTVTTTEMSDLEKEVDSQGLSDPSEDFSDVDKDINSL